MLQASSTSLESGLIKQSENLPCMLKTEEEEDRQRKSWASALYVGQEEHGQEGDRQEGDRQGENKG